MNPSPFLSGFASDVWVQRETTVLASSAETVYNTTRITGYLIEAGSIHRLTRTGPAWRQDVFRNLQNAVTLTLKFELRATSPISQLLRSILSLYNVTVDPVTGIETQTWEPDFTDEVHTVKIWLKDSATGKVYLHEGCAVADATVTIQSRAIPTIQFSLVCLRTQVLESLDDPGTLFADVQDRPIFLPQLSRPLWSDDLMVDPVAIYGATRMAARITRDLTPVGFRGHSGTRFEKGVASLMGSFDMPIGSAWWGRIATPEIVGLALFRFAYTGGFSLDALFGKTALTFDQASLHSTGQSNSLTMNLQPTQDFSQSPVKLVLTRMADGFDGGELADNDLPQDETLTGGVFGDTLTPPSISGGSF